MSQLLQGAQNAAGVALANCFDIARFLQQFTADVQRQIRAVNHPAHEAQILWQQLLGIVHDEHAFDIQFQAHLVLAVVQIMRCLRGDEQQLRVFGRTLDAVVRPCERLFEIMADVFVKFAVLLVCDVLFRPCPQCAC